MLSRAYSVLLSVPAIFNDFHYSNKNKPISVAAHISVSLLHIKFLSSLIYTPISSSPQTHAPLAQSTHLLSSIGNKDNERCTYS